MEDLADTPRPIVHKAGWVQQPVPLKTKRTYRFHGVEYPMNPGDSTSLSLMKQKNLCQPPCYLHWESFCSSAQRCYFKNAYIISRLH